MHVLVNSDHHITGDETLTERVETLVQGTLSRFADRITRVEVHLNDVNGDKLGGHDKRCMMEARLGGIRPIAVTHQASTVLEAMDTAVEKLERAIEHALGKLKHSAGRAPLESQIASVEDLQQLEATENERKKSAR